MTNTKTIATAIAGAAVVALASFSTPAEAQDPVEVDVELQLLVDVSGSVDSNEFVLQRDGYVNAFKSPSIINAITSTTDPSGNPRKGKIAAELIYWSSSNRQNVAVPWTLIDSQQASSDFADAISAATRPFSGSTAPGSAINFGDDRFFSNNFDGDSLVMDVSGDGAQNDGVNTANARTAALNLGIDRINGIAIGGNASVEQFYQNAIVGGADSFFLAASSFSDFQDAIDDKILAEVTDTTPGQQVPVPSTVLLLGVALLGLGLFGRQRMVT